MSRDTKLFRVNLAEELRVLRKRAAMSTRSVAAELGTSAAWVSRTETGTRQPSWTEVASLCRLYGASDFLLQLLLEKVAETDERVAQLPPSGSCTDPLADVMLLENKAHRVTEFELALVPGLLQTGHYARNILATGDCSRAELERRLSVRLGRQAVLSRPNGPEMRFLLDEFVLMRVVGDRRVMRDQLRNVLKQVQRPNVRVRIIPAASGAHAGLDGSFAVYEFADLDTYVYLEDRKGGFFRTGSSGADEYVDVRDELWSTALDEEQSQGLLRQVAEGLDDGRTGVAQERSERLVHELRGGGVPA